LLGFVVVVVVVAAAAALQPEPIGQSNIVTIMLLKSPRCEVMKNIKIYLENIISKLSTERTF
jgi:hypothetical protein